jgi:hypothetical protein
MSKVTGWVTGFEPDDHENDVFLISDHVTRENMEIPVTTRHPSPLSSDEGRT